MPSLASEPPAFTIDLPGDRSYPVFFQPLATVPDLLAHHALVPGTCLVVTDANVEPLYAPPLLAGLEAGGWMPHHYVVPAGEASKRASALQRLYDWALGLGIDRSTPVLALGGGVVGDLAGYAAATLLRGLPLVHLPTSLIAQVDSALGGKTGINHPAGKNLIGAFYQPRFVCADPDTPATLPEREWASGLAEVVKHALIASPDLLQRLEQHWSAILQRDPAVVPPLVRDAAAIKGGIVAADEREQGRRAVLNLGHTFGHAIERVAGYGHFTHGEAVALGLRAALHLSHAVHPSVPLGRLDALVRGIPIAAPTTDLAHDDLMTAMQTDKKVQRGAVRFVLLRAVGEPYLTAEVPEAAVRAAWTFALGE